jgi:hypothetical protein
MRRKWDGVGKVEIAVGPCVQQQEAGEEVGVKNPKLSRHGSILGCIRAEGGPVQLQNPPCDNLWEVGTWE